MCQRRLPAPRVVVAAWHSEVPLPQACWRPLRQHCRHSVRAAVAAVAQLQRHTALQPSPQALLHPASAAPPTRLPPARVHPCPLALLLPAVVETISRGGRGTGSSMRACSCFQKERVPTATGDAMQAGRMRQGRLVQCSLAPAGLVRRAVGLQPCGLAWWPGRAKPQAGLSALRLGLPRHPAALRMAAAMCARVT